NSCTYSFGPDVSVNGYVLTIQTDGFNTYLGGNFTTVQGVTRNNVAAIDPSGNVLPFNPNMNKEVNSLLLSGTTLYAGGFFTNVNDGWVNSYGVEIDSSGNANQSFPSINNSLLVTI